MSRGESGCKSILGDRLRRLRHANTRGDQTRLPSSADNMLTPNTLVIKAANATNIRLVCIIACGTERTAANVALQRLAHNSAHS